MPDLGDRCPPGLNPAKCDPWGLDSFQLFPNFMILVWSHGWYLTYHYWPTSYNTHIFEGTLYFAAAKTARERMRTGDWPRRRSRNTDFRTANTLEATQTMLESRVIDTFPLCDQEVLSATCTR